MTTHNLKQLFFYIVTLCNYRSHKIIDPSGLDIFYGRPLTHLNLAILKVSQVGILQTGCP